VNPGLLESSLVLPDYQGLRVLVVGSSGFVGRWVAKALAAQGADLHAAARDQERSRAVLAAAGVDASVHQLNVLDHACILALVRRIQPALTFNLAGYGVDPFERDVEMAYRINVSALEALYTAVASTERPAWRGLDLVHVGSALEYGAVGGILAEETSPRPTNTYGRSKLEGTLRLQQASQRLHFKAVTARLFTVYGPGEHSGRLLPSLQQVARSDGPIPLTEGNQKRDFTYVDDVAEGLLRLALLGSKSGEVVNLATGRLTTVRAFAETAARSLHIRRNRLQFGALPTRAEEMEHLEVRVERLNQWIGWVPSQSIESGIQKSVNTRLNAFSTPS
jgi:nucleoside-diphosphate-sugar epimerase